MFSKAHTATELKQADDADSGRAPGVRGKVVRPKLEKIQSGIPKKPHVRGNQTKLVQFLSVAYHWAGANGLDTTLKAFPQTSQRDAAHVPEQKATRQLRPHIRTQQPSQRIEQASQARALEALAGRLEKDEDAISKLNQAVDDLTMRLPTQQQSLARHAISSFRRVVAGGAQNKPATTTSIARHRMSIRDSTGSAPGKPTRIPRPVPSSPLSLTFADSTSIKELNKELKDPEAKIPQGSSDAVLSHLHECRTHDRYAKCWAIAAQNAADRAYQHQALATTALKSFGQLLDDLMGDPELNARAGEYKEQRNSKFSDST